MQPRLKRRVLVIEDDPDVRKLITDSLREGGIDVVAAVDGAHALRSALVSRPSAVILDLGLPELDGVDFITRWRERAPQASEIPILVVSGRQDAHELAEIIGAAKVFGKPFAVDELVVEVDRTLAAT